MGLVSFESFMEFNSIIDPFVTYYDIPIFKLGTIAAEMLFDRINRKGAPKRIILDGCIKIGNSTKNKVN